MEDSYRENVRSLKALADQNRLAIIDLLSCGELCACRILEQFDISQPTLSHHMKILCGCGLVTGRKEGRWTYYSLDSRRARELQSFLSTLMSNKDNYTGTATERRHA